MRSYRRAAFRVLEVRPEPSVTREQTPHMTRFAMVALLTLVLGPLATIGVLHVSAALQVPQRVAMVLEAAR